MQYRIIQCQHGPIPLLQLPEPAKDVVLAHLAGRDKQSLRLACTAAVSLVDERATRLFISLDLEAVQRFPLQRRFPRLSFCSMAVHSVSAQRSKQDSAAVISSHIAAVLEHGGAWPSVRELHIRCLPEDAVLLLMAACPNVHTFDATMMEQGHPVDYVRTIGAAASWTRLTSLCLPFNQLGDVELQALSGCAALTSLEVVVGDVSRIGWAAVGSMQLENLSVQHGQPSESLDMDLHSLTHLTSLVVKGPSTDIIDCSELYKHLHAPSTVARLTCQHLPAASFTLPCLAVLALDWHALTNQDIVQLAVGAPALRELYLTDLRLAAAAPAAQMTALELLDVRRGVWAQEGARLAAAFPNLKNVCMDADCIVEDAALFFEGATALERLDIGPGRVHFDTGSYACGMGLQQSAFDVLAQLPALTWLRLRAESEHFAGLGQLQQLKEVEWVFDFHDDYDCTELDVSGRAPAQLRRVVANFFRVPRCDVQSQSAHAVSRTTGALIMWLVHAPALIDIFWQLDYDEFAAMDALRLSALAASTSIQHVTVVPGITDVGTLSDTLQQEVLMLAQRGIKVVVQRPQPVEFLAQTWPFTDDDI